MIYRWTLHTPQPEDNFGLGNYLGLVHRFEQAGFVVHRGGRCFLVDHIPKTKLFVIHMSKYALDLFILNETGLCPFSVECVKIEQ
jgi:hypothetical protein